MSNDFSSLAASPAIIQDSSRARPRYFDGKFLTAADLMKEQAYLLRRQEDISSTLGFGVANGLEVHAVDNHTRKVRIKAGSGLTPDGSLVSLPSDQEIDLADVPRIIALNAAFGLSQQVQQPFGQLSGLFVIGLRPVEFTANPVPGYPASVGTAAVSQDGEIIEATAVTLVPYESAASQLPRAAARSRAARELFLEQRPPKLPAGVLPLAMLHLASGSLSWIDNWLVRRELGDDERFGFGFAPRALAEAHFLHYLDRLPSLPITGDPSKFAARSVLEILPPCGRLPDGVLRLSDFTQSFFPPEARVQLALIPEDELPALLEQSMELPPLDLSLKPENNDALSLFILAPVRRAEFADQWDMLRLPRTVGSLAPSSLGQLRPIDALLRLNQTVNTRTQVPIFKPQIFATKQAASQAILDGRWAGILSKVPHLWYARLRSLPDSSSLAATPVMLTGPDIGEKEEKLGQILDKEGLQIRFLFLKLLADARTHARLVRNLNTALADQGPLGLHLVLASTVYAVFKDMDELVHFDAEKLLKVAITHDQKLKEETLRAAEAGSSPQILKAVIPQLTTPIPELAASAELRQLLTNTGGAGLLLHIVQRHTGNPDLATLLAELGQIFQARDLPKATDFIKHLSQKFPV